MGLGVAGVWGVRGVCGVVGVCGVWGLWEDGLVGLAFGGLGVLEGGKDGGELVCRVTTECCLSGAGNGVGEGGLVMEWMSLDGLGAVGGGTGLGETGGGIFFPSTKQREKETKSHKSCSCVPPPHLTQTHNHTLYVPGLPGVPGPGSGTLLLAGIGGVCGPLFICPTTGLGETGRLRFSLRNNFIDHRSCLVHTVPARSSSHLRLRLRLGLILRLRLRLGLILMVG